MKKNQINYKIRNIKTSEIYVLDNFLYEAIFQKNNKDRLPKDIIKKPELQVYIAEFGKESDYCLVAEYEKEIIGCVWVRILSEQIKGFGNIDDKTPEFAISILKDFRGYGIGTSLMISMLKLLRDKGFKKASLAVQKDNYALKMYQNIGFQIIGENEEEFLMIYNINKKTNI